MAGDVVPAAGQVRVLVWNRNSSGVPGRIESAYADVTAVLAGTPGLLGSELLRSRPDPNTLLVVSNWASMEAFLAWERTAEHRAATAPLRPYRDFSRTHPFELYEVVEP